MTCQICIYCLEFETILLISILIKQSYIFWPALSSFNVHNVLKKHENKEK